MMTLGRIALIACLLLVPSLAGATDCVISSVQKSRQYAKCTDLKGRVGDRVTVTVVALNTVRVAPGDGTIAAALRQVPTSGTLTLILSTGKYAGNLTLARLPVPVTIIADAPLLPAAGERVTPAAEGRLPQIVPTQLDAPTITVQGDNYTFRGLQVETPGVGYTTIEVDGSINPRPSNIVFDQLLVRGSDTGGHRGIAANGINVTSANSWIDRMWEVSRDSQAIAAWDTPGPLRVENNYLEASGENFLLGGSAPTCGCVTSDVIFTRNTVQKDVAWKTMTPSPQVKNLFEIKSGRRVMATNNMFRYNWQQAQTGWAILFTTNVDSGPSAVVEDVTFSGNLIRDVSSGVNLASVAGPVRRIRIEQNIWANLDLRTWGGDGRWAMVQGGTIGAADLAFVHNTVIGLTGNQFIGLYSNVPLTGFVMTHNVMEQRDYGIHSESGLAADALVAVAPGSVFTDNAIIGPQVYYLKWPAGNTVLDVSIAAQFDPSYAMVPGSPLLGVQTSDGVRVGADRFVMP